jgi:lipid A oxidase
MGAQMSWTLVLRSPAWRLLVVTTAVLLIAATPAQAQWYAGVQFGVNRTASSTVDIDAPAAGLSQQFHDVQFEGRSFSSPPYYGWRVGRVITTTRGISFAAEFEFVHAKVYSETGRTYVVTPISGGGPTTNFALMSDTVQRYDMSHGLNFALANLVIQAPLRKSGDGPVSLSLRIGFGPMIPHAETTVLGQSREQYEYGGMAFGGGVGATVRLVGRLSGMTEYKVTFGRPEITLAQGTGRASVLMHHVIAGVIVRITN